MFWALGNLGVQTESFRGGQRKSTLCGCFFFYLEVDIGLSDYCTKVKATPCLFARPVLPIL